MTVSSDIELIAMLRESALALTEGAHDRKRLEFAGTPKSQFDEALWHELSGAGWTGILVDERHGGMGLGSDAAAELLNVVGASLLPEPVLGTAMLPAAIFRSLLDAPGVAEMAAELAGGHPFAVGLRCADARYSVQIVDDTLSGTCSSVSLHPNASTILVFAEQDGEPALAAVNLSGLGVEKQEFIAGDSSLAADIRFTAAPLGNLLAVRAEARKASDAALIMGRLGLAAMMTGAANTLLELVLEHLRTRVQFDRPIGSLQVLRHHAVDLKIAVELAEAGWRAAAAEPNAMMAAAAKARAGQTIVSVTRAAIQLFGAMGFAEEGGIGPYVRAANWWSAWMGNSRQLRVEAFGQSEDYPS